MSSADIATSYANLVDRLRELGFAYYRDGRLRDASHVLRSGEELIENAADGDVREYDHARLALAHGFVLVQNTFYSNAGYDQAIDQAERARQLAESAARAELVASANDLIGMAYHFRALHTGEDRYEQALILFRNALGTREDLQDTRGIAESLFHIGLVHQRKGNSEEARRYYEHALNTATVHGHKLEESYALRHLAGIAEDAGDLDTALVYFRRSLDLRDELGYRLLRPLSLLAIGDALQAQGQEAEAEEQYQSALALCETMELPLAQMETLLSLGSARQKNGDREEARTWYLRALAIAESHNFGDRIAAARDGLTATTTS